MKLQDLTGLTFGRLTVIERAENSKAGKARWLCRCRCGNLCVVRSSDLKNGHTQSCGCLHNEGNHKTHGMKGTSIYHTWNHMIGRCENPNNAKYPIYGGRGIRVCSRWHIFQNFYDDVSKLPHFGEGGYSLDRIDNDGDYCPGNVRWATVKEQANNRRTNVKVIYNGEEMILKDTAKISGINYNTLYRRYRKGKRGDDLFVPF